MLALARSATRSMLSPAYPEVDLGNGRVQDRQIQRMTAPPGPRTVILGGAAAATSGTVSERGMANGS